MSTRLGGYTAYPEVKNKGYHLPCEINEKWNPAINRSPMRLNSVNGHDANNK